MQPQREPQRVTDTIFAPATPPGKSAICVIRISGPSVQHVYQRIIRSPSPSSPSPSNDSDNSSCWPPTPRRALLRAVHDPLTSEKIDQGLVLFFPAAASLTAQDLLELHLHGSTAVLKATLAALSKIKGLRPAEPGEFTRLAFDGGKMDLTEVEGLRDLIESQTEAQRRVAVRQAGVRQYSISLSLSHTHTVADAFGRRSLEQNTTADIHTYVRTYVRTIQQGQMRAAYDSMRSDIISAMSAAEACIDFGEDDDISLSSFRPAITRISALRAKISSHLLRSATSAEILRSGIRLAVFGAPNAGKSSFVNWLVRREASIVTAHPGTTRDVLELSLDLAGYPVIVSDTAGLRDATDEVEQIGVQRAKAV